ncbi:hypothetical protein [Microbacterium forte]|uniref:hypothetical protein n=1 Tax=Microbacterium forte TaxID=2982533 RepID=UPI0028932E5D|nr:hypothetical protein [Microbacterium sp. A(2022)]
MSSPVYKVEGGRELRRTLRQAGDDLQDLTKAHREAAEIAARASSALAPVKSGRLRDTIRAAGTKTAGIVRAGFARVPYAAVIHWGWGRRHIKAQPFISRGAQDSEGSWIRVYEDYIETTIQKVKGTT